MLDPGAHLHMVKENAVGAPPRPGSLKRIRTLRFTNPGFDRAEWRTMCGDGWLGYGVAKESGGSARGIRRFCDLAERLGAGLVPEPVIAAAMAASLLPPQLLPAVLSGERVVLAAWQEAPGSLETGGDTTLSDRVLRGRKVQVPMAAGADAFLVSTRDGLALVECDAPGMALEIRQTADGGHLGTLTFDGAPAEPIPGDPADALEHAIMATASYLFGLTERAVAITREHMKRSTPAPGITNPQQQMDNIQTQLALTRSVVRPAVASMDFQPLEARQVLVSRAKLRAADSALMVTRACVQLHGPAGTLDAHDIGLFLKKATVVAPLYGSPSAHRARFVEGGARPMPTMPPPMMA